MRKIAIVTTAFIFCISLTVSAQIQRGNIMVGGDIANLDLSLEKGGFFQVTLDPKLAVFLNDNVALGGYLTFGLTTAKESGTNTNYGIGALGRYYFSGSKPELVRHSCFFVEANAGIEGTNPASGENTNGLGVGIGPGWTYFITNSVGLEALVKYRGIVGFGSRTTSSDLNLNVGFQIYLPTSRMKERLEGK